MSNLQPGQMRLHDRMDPQLRPGDHQLDAAQSVQSEARTLATVAPSTVKFTIVDPGAGPLPATEVLAVYPPAGAEDATDVMLPHIVLRSRSLPWANALPGTPDAPWLALLLFADGDATLAPDADKRVHARVSHARLRALMPRRSELARLCHVRELPTEDPLAARDDDRCVAIVMGNRLPRASGTATRAKHTACLVDLRPVAAAPIWPDSPVTAGEQLLPVLHQWSFEVSSGGDFEAYFRRLRTPEVSGTGGVVAFGSASDGQPIATDEGELDLAAPRQGDPGRTVRYGGPCTPVPLALIDAPADDPDLLHGVSLDGKHEIVTYAAAFELGRLLALANHRVLDALLEFRDHQFQKDVELVIDSPLPGVPAPDGPDIRANWRDLFNDTTDWMTGTSDTLWHRGADPTGIMRLVGQVPGLGFDQLAQLGSSRFTRRLTDLAAVSTGEATIAPTLSLPDLAGVDISLPGAGELLHDHFSELTTSIAHIDVDTAAKDFTR